MVLCKKKIERVSLNSIVDSNMKLNYTLLDEMDSKKDIRASVPSRRASTTDVARNWSPSRYEESKSDVQTPEPNYQHLFFENARLKEELKRMRREQIAPSFSALCEMIRVNHMDSALDICLHVSVISLFFLLVKAYRGK